MFPKKIKVTDGISLSVINTDKFKSSVFSFSLTTKYSLENSANVTILAKLLNRGSKKYPSIAEVNRALDELYSSYLEIKSNRKVNMLSFNLTADILDNKYALDGTDILGGVISVTADLLFNPLFLTEDFEDIFEHEKKLISDSLKASRVNPRSYATMRCAELVSRDEPCSFTLEMLMEAHEATTLESVREFYRNLLSASHIDVFYIGGESGDAVAAKLKSCFADFAPNSLTEEFCRPRAYMHKPYVFGSEQLPVSQGKLAMGFNMGVTLADGIHKYCTALLLNEIFGGSAASKLFLNVRERMSLCYYCSSSCGLYTGSMLVSCGFEVKNFEKVRSAILAEFENIQNGDISEFELEAAKKSLINVYTQLYDTPIELQAFYGERIFFGILDRIEDCISEFSSITAEEISALAQKISLAAAFYVEGTGIPTEESEGDEYDE